MEHDIAAQVLAAREDPQAADELVRQYLPFIRSETAKAIGRPPVEGVDDELGIAMFAFHQAALAYDSSRGAFLPLAAAAIRNRIIDYRRKERRHEGVLSLDQRLDDGDSRTLLDQLDTGRDELAERQVRQEAREEIGEFAVQLREFGLGLTDVAADCPRQARTLATCHRALDYAKGHPALLEQLLATRRLPLNALAEGSGVERKTLERHRRYLVAILLAYTNGFEIIRGHLGQMTVRGGQGR